MTSIQKWSALAAALAIASAGALWGQAQRTVVYTHDVSVAGREGVVTVVEIAPGRSAGRHTHPGDEISYVAEGEGDISMEDQPTRHVKAGDGFVIPAGTRHNATNTGAQTFKLVAIYVVEKGKPLATPAP